MLFYEIKQVTGMYLDFFELQTDPFPEILEDTPPDRMLSEKETGAYVRRRLIKAGVKGQVFDAPAMRTVYSYSWGDPKLIHQICGFALQRAHRKQTRKIRQELICECLSLLLESRTPDFLPDDRRKHGRVDVEFQGSYVVEGAKTKGLLTVTNISFSGLQVRTEKQKEFNVGDRVVISFRMDDADQTMVRNFCVVRNTFGFYAGCAFTSPNIDGYYDYISRKAKKSAT